MLVLKKPYLNNLRLTFRELRSYDKKLILILLVSVMIDAIKPFPNVLISGRIVDSLVVASVFSDVIFWIGVLFSVDLVLTTGRILLSKSRDVYFLKLLNKIDNDINDKCLRVDYEHFNDSLTQDRIMLISQAIYGKNIFTSFTSFLEIVAKLITIVGLVFVMTSLNTSFVVVSVIVILLQTWLHCKKVKNDRKFRADSVHEQRSISYISGMAKDIAIKKDVVTYEMADFIMNKIKGFQLLVLKREKKRMGVEKTTEIAIYVLNIIFQVYAYIMLGRDVFAGRISVGDFTVGITSLISFMTTSSYIATNIVELSDGFFYMKQYNSFLKMDSEYLRPSEVSINDIDLKKAKIEFKNVSFRYPNSTSYVLRNVNLCIEPGDKIGIVGFNGAGKTTLVLLLTRMYEPTEGQILLNGVDIKKIGYSEYQKLFATVYQDFSIMPFSLASNIAIKDELTDDDRRDILALIEKNGLSERINKLYRGIDTPVSKRLSASGIDLSGGEQQKLAIIRAMYKKAPFLILDEPTSALDPVAESEIYRKFASLSAEKTTIFISHRIYSTKFCNKIMVFEKGRIVECGNFDELLKLKGLYYKFYTEQAKNYVL